MRDVVEENALGREVTRRREELGLSQRRAAMESGVGETTWRNIERGAEYRGGSLLPLTNAPERLTVRKIARVLGWDANEALRAAGYDEPVSDTEARADTEASWDDQLSTLWRRLPTADRDMVLSMMARLAEADLPVRWRRSDPSEQRARRTDEETEE